MMRRRTAVHVAGLVVAALVAYAGSFSGEWISDDVSSIAEDPLIHSLAPANLGPLLKTFDGPNYAPLKQLSLAIDWQLFGNHPAGFHAVNLAFHTANAILIYV